MSEQKVRPLFVELPFVVKTYDVDFARIVHNMVYIRWLEDLRFQILAEYFPITEMLAEKLGPILTRTEIAYRWPLRLEDVALGRMWVSDLGNTRWAVQGEIWVGEKMAVTATQTGYFADMRTMRPVRVPERLQAAWEAARQEQQRIS